MQSDKHPGKKAQTSALLIVIVLIIFGSIAAFVLNITRTLDFDEYTNVYVNNLLLAVLRTDTGYTEPECRLVSDLLTCAYFTPNYQCGGDGPQCLNLANETITGHMSQFELVRKNYRYLFAIKPQGFVSETSINIGDPQLDCDPANRNCPRIEKFSATGIIQRGSYVLKAQLIVAKK